jgi:tRNA-dihydrouridine synthase A
VELQLGGSEPHELATAASIGEDFGYEINLNVDCVIDVHVCCPRSIRSSD